MVKEETGSRASRRLPSHIVWLLTAIPVWSVAAAGEPEPIALSMDVTLGVRKDNLQWSIADPSGTPNILSELTWRDVRTWELGGRFRGLTRSHFAFGIDGALGWIQKGSNQDSDYHGDDRTIEFSRSTSKTGGDTYDFLGYVGYQFDIALTGNRNLSLQPQAGYAHFRQHLNIHEGTQIIREANNVISVLDPPEPIPGLDSGYDATWRHFWLGVELGLQATEAAYVEIAYRYFANGTYHAEANWNLRNDLAHPVSFVHDSEADGYDWSVRFRYLLEPGWWLNCRYTQGEWQTNKVGVDTTFTPSGQTGSAPLREVSWDTKNLQIGVTREF